MNFGDNQGPQRPISDSGSLDGKIAATASPYPAAKKKKQSRSAPADAQPSIINAADVLCGRGKASFNHAGNKRFRDLITTSIPEYNRAESRLEKSLCVHKIVESIRGAGGRFLKVDRSTGQWQELDHRASRDKVGHAIRDAATAATTTENRRKKKTEQQFPQVGSTNAAMLQWQGPVSRYTEMKMDTPDPVSFHDAVHSTLMGRQIAFAASSTHEMGTSHQADTLAASQQSLPPTTEQQELDGQSAGYGTYQQQQQQHPDEAVFLEQIDQVLGPMPANHDVDPLAEILDLS